MTLPQVQARRFARHPQHRSEWAATGNQRIGWLGDPDHQPMRQTPVQRTANELIAAEQAFAETQTRSVSARRAVAEELRLFGPAGAHGRGYLASQADLDAAEQVSEMAMQRVETLRQQLHEQRRLVLVTDDADEAAERALLRAELRYIGQAAEPTPSLLGRLFRVAAGR